MVKELLADQLIGRDETWPSLAGCLDEAVAGEAGAVLILGTAGMGKSRLLRELAVKAEAQGAWVLTGRAVQGSAPDAYRPLLESLASFDMISGCEPGDQLWVAWQAAWRGLRIAGAGPAGAGEELVRLFRYASRRSTVVLALDDLHWADRETLAAVTYLCDNLNSHGALTVLAARPDEGLEESLNRLIDRRALDVVELSPLSPASIAELVLDCLGVDAIAPELTQFVQRRAGGNPFAVEELIAGLVRSGAIVRDGPSWRVESPRLHTLAPPTVSASVARRMAMMPQGARVVVQTAALLGHTFDWRLLGPITGHTDEDVTAALRLAQECGLLSSSGPVLEFRHALTRDEVLRSMLPPERRRLAQRAYDVVTSPPEAEDVDEGTEDLVLELAEHVGNRDEWRSLLLRSGVRAAERGSLSRAASRLRPLVEDPRSPHDDVTWEATAHLVDVFASMGEPGAARRAAQLLASGAALKPRSDLLQRLHHGLARSALAAGDFTVAAAHAGQLHPATAGKGTPATQLLLRAQVLLGMGELDPAAALAGQLLDESDATPADRCEAMEILGRCTRVTDVPTAQSWFERELVQARAADDSRWQARALHELGTIDLLDSLRLDRLEGARRLALQAGIPATVVHADHHLAEALVSRGETLAGRLAAERAADLASRIGSPVLPWTWLTVARSYAYERDDPAMGAAIAKARGAASAEPEAVEAGVSGRVLALRALYGADRCLALSHLDEAVARLRHLPGHHFPHWGLWILLRPRRVLGPGGPRPSAGRGGSRNTVQHRLGQGRRRSPAGRCGRP